MRPHDLTRLACTASALLFMVRPLGAGELRPLKPFRARMVAGKPVLKYEVENRTHFREKNGDSGWQQSAEVCRFRTTLSPHKLLKCLT